MVKQLTKFGKSGLAVPSGKSALYSVWPALQAGLSDPDAIVVPSFTQAEFFFLYTSLAVELQHEGREASGVYSTFRFLQSNSWDSNLVVLGPKNLYFYQHLQITLVQVLDKSHLEKSCFGDFMSTFWIGGNKNYKRSLKKEPLKKKTHTKTCVCYSLFQEVSSGCHQATFLKRILNSLSLILPDKNAVFPNFFLLFHPF